MASIICTAWGKEFVLDTFILKGILARFLIYEPHEPKENMIQEIQLELKRMKYAIELIDNLSEIEREADKETFRREVTDAAD